MTYLHIDIGPDLRLTADDLQFILQQRRKYKDRVVWKPLGYFSKLEYVIEWILAHKIRTRGRTTLGELLRHHTALKQELKEIIEKAVISLGEKK